MRYVVKAYRGRELVGQVSFFISDRAPRGSVSARSCDRELQKYMRALPSECAWQELVDKLTKEISIDSAGRFTFRFTRTPSPEGRGDDEVLARSFRRHAGL